MAGTRPALEFITKGRDEKGIGAAQLLFLPPFHGAVARRVAAPDLVQLLDDADRRWRPDVILFESNAAFAGIRDLLLRHAGFGPKVKSVMQTRDKHSRVLAFSVPVENGAFRLKGRASQVDAGQQELWDEMVAFPAGEHDDLLDAAAMGTAYLLDRPEPRVW